jgi:hypothetical protein
MEMEMLRVSPWAFQSKASQQVSLHHAAHENNSGSPTVAHLKTWRTALTVSMLHRFVRGVVKLRRRIESARGFTKIEHSEGKCEFSLCLQI